MRRLYVGGLPAPCYDFMLTTFLNQVSTGICVHLVDACRWALCVSVEGSSSSSSSSSCCFSLACTPLARHCSKHPSVHPPSPPLLPPPPPTPPSPFSTESAPLPAPAPAPAPNPPACSQHTTLPPAGPDGAGHLPGGGQGPHCLLPVHPRAQLCIHRVWVSGWLPSDTHSSWPSRQTIQRDTLRFGLARLASA